MSRRREWLGLLGLAALASQAGHLLVYQLRFGATAQQLQTSGAHAYFPALAKTGAGVLAALTVGSLFIIGVARIAGGQELSRDPSSRPFLRLVAAMYTIQVGIFVVQEVIESKLAGTPGPSFALLLLWGTLGQLPVAALAAAGLRWLLVRIRSAVQVCAALSQPGLETAVAQLLRPVSVGSHGALLRSQGGRSLVAERGPPSPLRFSSS